MTIKQLFKFSEHVFPYLQNESNDKPIVLIF